MEIVKDKVLDRFHHFVRPAGVEYGLGGVINEAFDPLGGHASAPTRPRVVWSQPGASHMEFETRIFFLQSGKLVKKDDILSGPDAVEHGDAGIEIASRRFPDKPPERRDT